MTDEQLRRTPLFDEHVAAGGRLVPFAGWEMPVQYEGVAAEHAAVRERAGIFDVSHMGQIRTSGPDAARFLQRAVTNDVDKLAIGGAQYSCLCADDGGILDDLFSYRFGDGSYMTVSNAANHESDLARFRALAEGFDVEIEDLAPAHSMLAVQGPEARSAVATLADGELPARMHTATLEVAGLQALVCGTGYTGEDGVEIILGNDGAVPLWRELLAAGVQPCGLGARDTLRLEVCFHLHGNDMGPDRNPIEAGLGWCCKEETGFAGSEAVSAARENGTAERLVAFAITDRGIPRPGNPILAGEEPIGTVTSGTFSPSLGIGIGMGYVRSDLAEPGTAIEIDVRGRRPGGGDPHEAALRDEQLTANRRKDHMATEESYPDDLRYHPEHDWAKVDGDQATFGITWFAQDSLGDVVFFDPPEVGATVSKDDPYTEVESVKAVSDVIAPLSGEILAVNEEAGTNPELINTDPYGKGWMVKVRLSDPAEVEALLDAAAYKDLIAD